LTNNQNSNMNKQLGKYLGIFVIVIITEIVGMWAKEALETAKKETITGGNN